MFCKQSPKLVRFKSQLHKNIFKLQWKRTTQWSVVLNWCISTNGIRRSLFRFNCGGGETQWRHRNEVRWSLHATDSSKHVFFDKIYCPNVPTAQWLTNIARRQRVVENLAQKFLDQKRRAWTETDTFTSYSKSFSTNFGLSLWACPSCSQSLQTFQYLKSSPNFLS